ncbi:MAG: tetratricopeptide repeat protein, partial [Azonexus sp.]|nr:tetratricopeptide repeat protein [Azonexus sp.]
RALAINPRFAQAHSNLGVALKSQGHQAEAEACFRKAIALNADCADAYNNLGTTLCEQRRFVEAEEAYVQALRVRPEFAEACYCLGSVLIAQQRLSEAETQLRKAVAYRPNYLDAHLNLGVALSRLGQFKKAKNCFQAVLAINPECDEAYAHLGVAESGLGETDLAIRYCRKAIEAKPGNANAHSGLLFMQSHSAMVDAAALFAEHCRYGEQFEAPLRDSWPQHTNTRDPERCLQIGFISADLYNHAVANFIEPIWACLADCPKVSLHAYYNDTIEDDVTRRLRAHVKQWHAIAFLPEADLAEKILEDKIDILIDLSGHTGKNRLLAFARKPAPVQASWMGYPGTTGLQAMDYYFADRYFLPPGQFDDQFTEKPVYLPVSVPFLPYESALPINDLPALSAGYLTFGSFNRLSKLSISTIALWSQLLRAVPECQ